jgi:hypothetical protein
MLLPEPEDLSWEGRFPSHSNWVKIFQDFDVKKISIQEGHHYAKTSQFQSKK